MLTSKCDIKSKEFLTENQVKEGDVVVVRESTFANYIGTILTKKNGRLMNLANIPPGMGVLDSWGSFTNVDQAQYKFEIVPAGTQIILTVA